MRNKILFVVFCAVLCLSEKVLAESENEVKRGRFPFMAYLYYLDESVTDESGGRFLRGAVLIRLDWLVSSAVDLDLSEGALGKTLLARAGAIRIDANFTLNEDENEQEREIIEIVRPYKHNRTRPWTTDITLLKTLLPFTSTSAVDAAQLPLRREYNEKTCTVLLFMKNFGKLSDDRILVQTPVELMPASKDNCGENFDKEYMTCATDPEDKNIMFISDYCQGCSGGPIICEDDVFGLQTYVNNNCMPPHLYHVLSSWSSFLNCGTTEKCVTDLCPNVCSVTLKDSPNNVTTHTAFTVKTTLKTEQPEIIHSMEIIKDEIVNSLLDIITTQKPVSETITTKEPTREEPTNTKTISVSPSTEPKYTTTSQMMEPETTTILQSMESEITTVIQSMESEITTVIQSTEAETTTITQITEPETTTVAQTTEPELKWSSDVENRRRVDIDESEDLPAGRSPNVAHHTEPIKAYSTAAKNVSVFQSLIISTFFVWVCTN